MHKNQLSEVKVADMTREDLKSFIKDIFADETDKGKKFLSKEDVRIIVREMLRKYFKQMYVNAPLYLDKL